jgi:hypothetical protein
VICWLVTPVPLTVIVAAREDDVVFAIAVTSSVAFVVPEAGVYESQLAPAGDLLTDQFTFDVTARGKVEEPPEGKDNDNGSIDNTGDVSIIVPKSFHGAADAYKPSLPAGTRKTAPLTLLGNVVVIDGGLAQPTDMYVSGLSPLVIIVNDVLLLISNSVNRFPLQRKSRNNTLLLKSNEVNRLEEQFKSVNNVFPLKSSDVNKLLEQCN